MSAKLAEIRASFTHAGNKGASVEESVRTLLRSYLPTSLRVGHGEVLDTAGLRSKQTDIVVVSDEHPFTFTETTPGQFLIEGVLAAGEVKSVLTSGELDNAITNSQVFKRLAPLGLNGSLANVSPSDLQRFVVRSRPWFLLALESQLSLETIGKRLIAVSGAGAATSTELVDAVFVLNTGSLINYGDGQGSLKLESGGQLVTGWAKLHGDTLLTMMAWLSVTMPRMWLGQSILPLYLVRRK